MNDNDHSSVAMPFFKIITAWAAALGSQISAVAVAVQAWASSLGLHTVTSAMGFQSWGDVASFMAAVYTALLIAEWVRNRFFRHKRLTDD